MTILLPNKILQQPRVLLWRTASQFEQAPRWVAGVEKTEHVSGQAANVGGVWRVHWRRGGSYQIIDFEITEWLEGERIGLRPLNMAVIKSDIELYQIVLNLKGLADSQTLVTVQYEYEPRHRLAKIKNLMFLRRRYLQRVEANLAALERVAGEQAMSS
jgi:hypothetical protein